MSCKCNDIKRFQNIEHVRNLAQKLANHDKEAYCIFKCYISTSVHYFDFAPDAKRSGSKVEILQPMQINTDTKAKGGNRRKRSKTADKESKVRKQIPET